MDSRLLGAKSDSRARFRAVALLIGALFLAAAAGAQETPYAGFEERPIKSLSTEQVRAYLEGEGMGLALAGELNGFPGPKHVLELRRQLGLSLDQLGAVEKSFDTMHAEAKRLGTEIVEWEQKLDLAFSSGEIDAATLAHMSEEIGRLGGRLRGVHLAAHLETAAVLSPHQRMQYATLRGYGTDGEHGRHH